MKEKIIHLLSEQSEWMKTIDISKQIIGIHGTKKDVNPCLYDLLKEGKICLSKNDRGGNPKWKIK